MLPDLNPDGTLKFNPQEWLDWDGNLSTPFPYYTPGAYSFVANHLNGFDRKKVLEFGGGWSTVWYAARGEIVTTIEHSREWASAIAATLLQKNVDGDTATIYVCEGDAYCYGLKTDERFDLVCVDGIRRGDCLSKALDLVKPGGLILLDNSNSQEMDPAEREATLAIMRCRNILHMPRHDFPHPEHPYWTTTIWEAPLGPAYPFPPADPTEALHARRARMARP